MTVLGGLTRAAQSLVASMRPEQARCKRNWAQVWCSWTGLSSLCVLSGDLNMSGIHLFRGLQCLYDR